VRSRDHLAESLSTQRVRPVITPDDPEKVAAELAGHGVNVS
jgi:hypothetical protein